MPSTTGAPVNRDTVGNNISMSCGHENGSRTAACACARVRVRVCVGAGVGGCAGCVTVQHAHSMLRTMMKICSLSVRPPSGESFSSPTPSVAHAIDAAVVIAHPDVALLRVDRGTTPIGSLLIDHTPRQLSSLYVVDTERRFH